MKAGKCHGMAEVGKGRLRVLRLPSFRRGEPEDKVHNDSPFGTAVSEMNIVWNYLSLPSSAMQSTV